MDKDDLNKTNQRGAKHKDSKTSLALSLVLGVVLLVFGVQDLVAGKVVLGVILTVAGVVNLFMAYKIWDRRQNG
jgi:uncharacterized membrane protein HdeD (DUF308 family)